MKKDEIIELLKEQLRVANDTVSSLTTQVGELIERIKSLEEQLVQKQGGRIKMRSPPKVLTGSFHPSQLSSFLS